MSHPVPESVPVPGVASRVRLPRADRPAPDWDQVYRRNSLERLKRDRPPVEVRAELPGLIDRGYEAVAEEDLVRDQWASRAAIKKVELDHDHGGIVKVNALADWQSEDVWDYVEEHRVPVHPLYAQAYTSFGCAPCTRPVRPGEDDRAGRWWWEDGAPKECGIHCPIETGAFEHEAQEILAGPR